jgi:hypothetical protein
MYLCNGRLLTLAAKIGTGLKCLTETNTLAYSVTELFTTIITTIKVQAVGACIYLSNSRLLV